MPLIARFTKSVTRKICAVVAGSLVLQPVLAQDYQFRVPLKARATGAAGGGHLAFSVDSQDFGAVLVRSAATQPITVTNTGEAAISLGSLTVEGQQFSKASNCGAFLAPADSCTVQITFAPSKSGHATATLVVESDDVPARVEIPLQGRGQAGTLTAANFTFEAPRQLAAPLVYGDIVVTNSTTAPVAVSSVSVAQGDVHFGQSNNCAGTIEPAGTCTVRASFVPQTAGALKGVIAIVSDSDASPTLIEVRGEGRLPSGTLAIPAYSALQTNDSEEQVATVTNTGVGSLTVGAVQVVGADYALVPGSSTCSSELAPSESCQFAVRFTPTQAGARPGTVSVPTNAGQLSQSLTGTGQSPSGALQSIAFGDVLAGASLSKVSVLRNTGIGSLTLSIPLVSGDGFSVAATTCGQSLAVNAQCDVTVQFGPASAGNKAGALSFATNAGTITSDLTARATQAELALAPATLPPFGDVQVGEHTDSTTLSLSNTGTAAATALTLTAPTGYSIIGSTCGTALSVGASCSFKVRFAPTQVAAYAQSLTVTSAAPSILATLGLQGSGVAQAGSLTPSLDFGGQPAGASTNQVATLSNTGKGPLTLLSAAVTGVGFSLEASTCGATVPANSSCTVTIKFSPTDGSSYAGTINLSTGAGALSTTLSGTGLQGTAVPSPANLSFGTLQVAQTSAAQQITLANSGNHPLAISGISISALASDYAQTNNCGATLVKGAACTISVAFTPSATASRDGVLLVAHNGPGGYTAIPLFGVGQAQSVSITDINFGNQSAGTNTDLTSIVTNTGVGPVSVTAPNSASVTGSGFSFVSSTCTGSLPANGSCSTTVRFSPSGKGTNSGTLTLATSAGTKTANLVGTGQQAQLAFSPATLAAFPATQTGQTVDSGTITLTNSGNVAATALTLQAPVGFSVATSTCGTSLAPSGTCTFQVRFNPGASQSYSGNVTATANAPSTPAALAVAGTAASPSATLTDVAYGGRAAGSTTDLTATLSNTGIGVMTLTAPSPGSVTGAGYAFVSTTCGSTLAANGTCAITVRFTPVVNASYPGTLTIATEAGIKTANLTGVGQQAVLSFSPSTIGAHPDTQVGQSVDSSTITLTNSGNIAAASLVLTPPTGFSIANTTCGTSLAAAGTCTFNVRFSPAAAQLYSSSVTATASAPASSASLSVSGAGKAQAASISDVSFGSRSANSTTDLVATLINTGVGPLTVTTPTASSVTGAGFSFVSTTCGTSLSMGGTCSTTVRFSPIDSNGYSGVLTVATGGGAKTANLTGAGLQGTGVANTSTLAFGAVQVAQTSTSQSVTVTNNGNTALTVSGVSISVLASDYAQSNNCGATLAQGASCTINLSFTPTTAGSRPGTLSMTHNGPGGFTNISLSGTGQAQSASLSGISYGSRNAGSSTDLTATLNNTGIGPLSVTVPSPASVSGTSYSFVSTTCSSSLPASTSCTTTVRFVPPGGSSYSGTLSIATGAGTQSSSLSGTGLQGSASLSSGSLSFGNVSVGSTSSTQTVTVTNNGTAPLTISGVSVSSGSSDFGQSNGCGTTLTVNGTCTINVSFTPAAAGARSGTVSLAHNGTGSTSFSLSGTGVGAASASANFGSATVTSGSSNTLSWTTSNASSVSINCTGVASYSYSGTSVNSSAAVGSSGSGSGTCYVTPYNSLGQSGSVASASFTAVSAPSVTSASFANANTAAGSTNSFSWSTSGASSASVSCSGAASGSGSGTSGTITVTTAGTGPASCSVSASNGAGGTANGGASFTVVAIPSASASFNYSAINVGGTPLFTWSTGGGASSATVACSGVATGSGSGLSGSFYAGSSGAGNGTCTVTATNAANSTTSASASFTAYPLATASSSISKSYVTTGQTNSFTWSTSNSSNVSVTCSGASSGSSTAASGTISVSTSGTGPASCTVTATNGAGTPASSSQSFTVVAAPSVTSAAFSPTSVTQGSASSFSWNTANASSASVTCSGGASGSGSGTSGTISVTGASQGSGTCTVTAYNLANSSATGSATLTINASTPVVSMSTSSVSFSVPGTCSLYQDWGASMQYYSECQWFGGTSITITNTGGGALTIGTAPSWVDISNGAEALVEGCGGVTLRAGQSCTMTVDVRYGTTLGSNPRDEFTPITASGSAPIYLSTGNRSVSISAYLPKPSQSW